MSYLSSLFSLYFYSPERAAIRLRVQLQNRCDIAWEFEGWLRKLIEQPSDRTLEIGKADDFFDSVLGLRSVERQENLPSEHMTENISASIEAVLRMIDTLELDEDDVLCDVGAGYFRIPILTNILCGSKTIGVELDEAFCKEAQRVIDTFSLEQITVLQQDALTADLSSANIFSFNLPFEDIYLEQFLAKLKNYANSKQICIYPYCWHYPFWGVPWLRPVPIPGSSDYYFCSEP